MKAGFYRVYLNRSAWVLPCRYMDLAAIGTGAFGQVCSARDSFSLNSDGSYSMVAIKKLHRPFQSQFHAKSAYREIKMLKHMNHDNVIRVIDCFSPSESIEDFSDIYLVTELMPVDLQKTIRTQQLDINKIKFLIYQILCGLKYIHSAGIIHRDLKPANLAKTHEWDLKILDFGQARPTVSAGQEMTGYVVTRWYRAPEVMLSWMRYHTPADMWSVGCIMGEMIRGTPLFTGTDHINQLTCIMDLCGTPPEDMVEKMTSHDAKDYIRSLPRKQKKDFRDEFPKATPDALDLLDRLLEWDVEKRITAQEALEHPFVDSYMDEDGVEYMLHDPGDEPVSEPYDQTFENEDFSIDVWKEKVWQELSDVF